MHGDLMKPCLLLAGLALSGCASYPADDAARGTVARPRRARFTVDAKLMLTPALRVHRFDPTDALEITEVAMLAAASNPDLKTRHTDLAVARVRWRGRRRDVPA